jgi:superfamily II DNA or RNA helicase
MTLRPYQHTLVTDVENAWAAGARNVLMRLDTGGGKTVILSDIVQRHPGASAVIAHRQELVGQLSLALARNGVRHRLIAAQPTIRAIAADHVAQLGRSWFDPGARCAVASVDTLIRAKGLESWAAQVTLWVTDEGHHVVNGNKWSSAIGMFTSPAVRGLLPTATPQRADGKGLGRHADGVADALVQGPPMRWLIEQGFLTDYRIVCPESDMQLLDEDVGASGDWSTAKLRAAARASHIVGDVVASYQRWGAGKLGVTFCPDTETAADVARAYVAAGVRAALLTGETDPGMRRHMLRQFAARELHQLVVVDIISEGFDLPAIEVASFARKTASLATYMQQFGRVLRPMEGKPHALIIDHVGNFLRHGPPDRPRDWSLDRRERRSSSGGGIPLRVCLACFQPYERVRSVCPYCQTPAPPPTSRGSPAQVEGDLAELDPEVLALLRGEVAERDMPTPDYGRWLASRRIEGPAYAGAIARHEAAHGAQSRLRTAMTAWCADALARGYSDRETHRLFWATFGVDVLSARALAAREASELAARIDGA